MKNQKRTEFIIFSCIVSIVLLFALYTQHAWEDWYITFRASKNLAMGRGLTFSPPQLVHSFTSVLGTVIPTFFSYITGNNSDDLVLWLYRICNAVFLGFSGIMLFRISQKAKLEKWASIFLVGMFMVDTKIIDFSINGMETAIMMFFLIAVFYNLYHRPIDKMYLYLGINFGLLMYTRPDSFIYWGSICLFLTLFCRKWQDTNITFSEWFVMFSKATAIAICLFLPWILFTWWYYGTPIPHTVIAKGLYHPFNIGINSFKSINIFLPPYNYLGGWEYVGSYFGFPIGLLATSCFLFYKTNLIGRMTSLVALIGVFYLNTFSGQGMLPWYIPNITILCIFSLAYLLNDIDGYLQRSSSQLALYGKIIYKTFIVASLACMVYMTVFFAYEAYYRQRVIEWPHRKEIGLWLKAHSKSNNETVFMECLGYIGYYSQLKTYDFPGMSSPETVAARKKIHAERPGEESEYGTVIEYLRPDWLVLRPDEVKDKTFLNLAYDPVKVFDARPNIPNTPWLKGKYYFDFDAYFTVYKKKSGF